MVTAPIAVINAFISFFVTMTFPVSILVLVKYCYRLPEKQNKPGEWNNSASCKQGGDSAPSAGPGRHKEGRNIPIK